MGMMQLHHSSLFKTDALFFAKKEGKSFPYHPTLVYDMAAGEKKLAEWGELIFMEHLPSNYRYVFFSTLWSLSIKPSPATKD